MTPENFAYWLTGFFELTDATTLSEYQVFQIKHHLELVFNKVTPGPFDFVPASKQPYCANQELGYSKAPTFYGSSKLFTAHTGVTAQGLC